MDLHCIHVLQTVQAHNPHLVCHWDKCHSSMDPPMFACTMFHQMPASALLFPYCVLTWPLNKAPNFLTAHAQLLTNIFCVHFLPVSTSLTTSAHIAKTVFQNCRHQPQKYLVSQTVWEATGRSATTGPYVNSSKGKVQMCWLSLDQNCHTTSSRPSSTALCTGATYCFLQQQYQQHSFFCLPPKLPSKGIIRSGNLQV